MGVFGVATRYELDGPGIDSRCGDIFRICPDRPWDPPSLMYNGYRVSFLDVKWQGRSDDYQPPSCVEVKGRVQIYICFPSEPSCPALE
jgi:hypothetical protein